MVDMPSLVLVDKNEQNNKEHYKQLVSYFPKVLAVNLPHRDYGTGEFRKHVTSGDLNIPLDSGELLAVERKTVDDFLNSIANRHIFHQVEIMAQNAKYSAVIVTGVLSYTNKGDMAKADGYETGWTGVRVRAVIAEIQYSGCPVLFCPHDLFCQSVLELYHIVNKSSDTRQGITKNRILTFPPVDARVEFLAQLPGVGIKLAEALLKLAGKMGKTKDADGYGTLASALHWLSIVLSLHPSERPKGWGKEKVLTARKFFGLAGDEYLAVVKELETKDMISIDGSLYAKTPF